MLKKSIFAVALSTVLSMAAAAQDAKTVKTRAVALG